METITLTQQNSFGVTPVSNIFIDHYMASANGSYVKVYLYLLRCLSSNNISFSISFLADRLEDTEKDILRALQYWEKNGLITLTKKNDNSITNITINDLKESSADYPGDSPDREYGASLEAAAVSDAGNPAPVKPAADNPQPSTALHHERPTYTETQIAELTNNEEIKWLLNIIEIYLERLLKPTDLQLILYLYETLGFSTELIMHLYDYCVSRNKKSPSYIEAVALSWAEDGIDTVEKAEQSMTRYNNSYNAVNKAFGLNRSPGAIEKQYIDKWLSSFGFHIDIIVEACSRSLLRTGKPDFKYADKILENWMKKGVKNKADILKLDEDHNNKASARNQNNNIAADRPKNENNRFNSFPQRNYTASDYSSLEQKLLNK